VDRGRHTITATMERQQRRRRRMQMLLLARHMARAAAAVSSLGRSLTQACSGHHPGLCPGAARHSNTFAARKLPSPSSILGRPLQVVMRACERRRRQRRPQHLTGTATRFGQSGRPTFQSSESLANPNLNRSRNQNHAPGVDCGRRSSAVIDLSCCCCRPPPIVPLPPLVAARQQHTGGGRHDPSDKGAALGQAGSPATGARAPATFVRLHRQLGPEPSARQCQRFGRP
jgi:hypothetical protein